MSHLIQELKRKLEAAYLAADHFSKISFSNYLKHVLIDSRPEPKKFSDLAEPWQWEQANVLGPAIESVCGVKKGYHGKRFFWRTMPRGHDKTSSIGRSLAWALAYCKRNFSAVVAAADREQAANLVEFMENEAKLNPWLYKRLEFKQNKVCGWNGAYVKVLAADAFGSFGMKNDIIICDELTHWPNRDLWDVLISGREKVPNSVMIVITNAGVIGSWQWDIMQAVKSSPFWHIYEAPGPLASWMSKERTADLRRTLPVNECRRVLDNEWLDPSEDCGFISRAEAEKCERLGSSMGLSLITKGNPDIIYVGSIDYGPKKDRTVCTIVHREIDNLIIDSMEVMEGKDFPDKRVPISEVEKWIELSKANFPKISFVIDQYQMESTIQKYSPNTTIERFSPRGGKANFEMAQILRDLIVNQRCFWYPGCGTILVKNTSGLALPHTLVDEFAELITKPMVYGYRLDHISGKHDDRVVSLGMAALKLMGTERKRIFKMHDAYC